MKTKITFFSATLLLAVTLLSNTTFAQAPANDNCSGAITLTVSTTSSCTGAVTGDVTGATQSLPAIVGDAGDDIWFRFIASSSEHYITVIGSAKFDPVVDLLSGTCNGTNITFIDASAMGGREVIKATGLTTGNTYYVRIYDYGSGVPVTTTFTICVTLPPAPSNNECTGAIALTVNGANCLTTTGDVTGATQSIPPACSGTISDDVWYKFVATSTNQEITVVGSSGFNAIVDLRSGACNGTSINCADGTSDGGTEIINATGLTIGNTYYVRVYDWSGATNTFTICVTNPSAPPPPANDECAGAIPLTVNTGTTCTTVTQGDVKDATQSSPSACIGTPNDDVWYSFVATQGRHEVKVVGSSQFNATVDLRSGACDGTSMNCSYSSTGGGTAVVNMSGLTVGNTYLVRVYDVNSSTPQTTTFTVCVTTPAQIPTPSNDNCSGAIALNVSGTTSCTGLVTGDAAGATQSIPAIYGGNANDDIWFSFVASAIALDITVTCSRYFDAIVDLRSGACNGNNIGFANGFADASHNGGIEVIKATGLTIGNTYYVRVYDYGSDFPATTTFTICVTLPIPVPPIPTNDECAGAIPLTVNGASCLILTEGSLASATQSIPPISCGIYGNATAAASKDVWFSFVATDTTHYITVVSSFDLHAIVDVRSGGCNGTPLYCADTSVYNGGTEVVHASRLTKGTTYYVRIYDYFAGSTKKFTICVTTPAALGSNCPRATMVNNYDNYYCGSEVTNTQLAWTGDTATCNAGTISTLSQTRTLDRVNYFRHLVGLPGVIFADTLNAKCQQAALMQVVNGQANHNPPPSWRCYTIDGDIASAGNLAGAIASNAVSAYIEDGGNGIGGAPNTAVGHRRNVLYSKLTVMGHGSTKFNDVLWSAIAGGPAINLDYIPFPSAGFFPAPLVPERWSFGKEGGADFTNATVQMTDASGVAVSLSVKTLAFYGDNTIVWEPLGVITDSIVDLAYTVHVNNVVNSGVSSNYTYTVVICPIAYPPQCPTGKSWLESNCNCSGGPVDINQLSANQQEISIYLNPTSGIINIEMGQVEKAQIKITDVLGNSVYQSNSTSSSIQIDLNAQANGVYFISIQTNEGIVNKKIVISK